MTRFIMRQGRAGILLLVLCALAGAMLELRLLEEFRSVNRADPALNNILFYSNAVVRNPNRTIPFRFYGPGASVLADAEVRTNNLGFLSRRDYPVSKTSGEFRIAVLGGEQTSSSVVNVSWPELLEERLLERYPNRNIKVFNLGWPDSGPAESLEIWRQHGERLKPDLTILNLIENDILRAANTHPEMPKQSTPLARFRGEPVAYTILEFRVGPNSDDAVKLSVPHPAGNAIRSLRDPGAVPARPYGFFASVGLLRDEARVSVLQRRLVDDMIAGGEPCFGCLLWSWATSRTLPSVAQVRNLDAVPASPVDQSLYLKLGGAVLLDLVRAIPHAVIIRNFDYSDWSQKRQGPLISTFVATNPDVQVCDMMSRVPAGTADSEVKSWYLYPYMTEKWSPQGHHVYAGMVADLLFERLGPNGPVVSQ